MRKGAGLWNPWILIPAGVIVAIVGLCILLQTLSRKKKYTGKAEATILSVTRSSHYSNGVTRHVYTPKVSYVIDGNSYEVNGQGSGKQDYYTQGEQITVYYNPDKPEKCVTIPFKDSARGANIAMLIGAGIGVLGLLAMFIK